MTYDVVLGSPRNASHPATSATRSGSGPSAQGQTAFSFGSGQLRMFPISRH
jgi:hypothetical protein